MEYLDVVKKRYSVRSPMATSKAEPDGKVSRAMLDYYAEKSQGGYISLEMLLKKDVPPFVL